MLTKFKNNKSLSWFVTLFFIIVSIIQLWLMQKLQLFGDEAFYWLEGQYLSLSYSELPGWTAWMIRLGTEIFGNNYFGVRIISYLGFVSIFPAAWLIYKSVDKSNQPNWLNLLLLLAVPIFILIAIMALPDIWLLVFVIWLVYFFSKACVSNSKKDWICIGLIIAISLNVHVRMWIWLFIAGLVFLIVYRKQAKIITSAVMIAFPIGLLGLLPVIIFNYQNDFVLFNFQFGQRHPWEFQVQNLNFLLSQLLIISPLVLFLWFYNSYKITKYKQNSLIVNWILLTAISHWLLYAILGLFADGLRTTVHWVLMSYIPVLVISTVFVRKAKLLFWIILSGLIFTISMLSFLSIDKKILSNTQARVLDNSSGWKQLSVHVAKLQSQHNIENIVADYFMTAAELAFELEQQDTIKVLSHAKNIKHGREKQLEIMGMLLKNPTQYNQEALLVVEDSTLKLINKGKYYAQLCKNFKQLDFLETVNINNSKKQFHIFKITNSPEVESKCQIPPLFYIQHIIQDEKYLISGWAIFHKVGIKSLTLQSGENTYAINSIGMDNAGIQVLFPEISDPNLPNNDFEISIPQSSIANEQFRIMALGSDGKEYYSHFYFLN